MATKNIKFNFFKIEFHSDNFENFKQALLTKIESPFPASSVNGNIHLLEEPRDFNGLICGTLIHNQMFGIPDSFDDKTKKNSKLNLTETQGLGYQTAFLFDPVIDFLIFESNKNGVSINNFINYYGINLKPDTLSHEIVIDPGDISKLENFKVIKKFRVKVAKIQNGAVFADKKSSFYSIGKAADISNSNYLDYTISAERKSSLKLGIIKNYVKELLQKNTDEEIQTLEISGVDEEENSDVLNLIANKVTIEIQITKKRFNSTFTSGEKYDAVYKAYQKIKGDLYKAYKKDASN